MSLSSQNAYNDIDKPIVARFSGLSQSGVYAAGYRAIDVAFAPVRALVFAAYPAFFRRGARGLKGSLAFAGRLMAPALLYALCGAGLLWWLAPLAGSVFGQGFAETASVVRWLAVLLPLRTIHYLGQDALTGADRQGARTAIQGGVVAGNLALSLLLIPRFGWRGAAAASIASEMMLAVGVWAVAARLAAREP
ncbi:MAG: hypothetical protein KatS3mg014_1751 [Actinomycetota bacterium]|nr:MAG: hypothetical protein KatS3mg014_1751 [Actinomycetota bacterium]